MTANAHLEPLELRLEGIFDVAAAQAVVRTIERAPKDRSIHVDLAHVRELHDFAVAVLAQGLVGCTERVQLRGLSQHQLRLLCYLGLGQAVEPFDAGDARV